MFIIAPRVITCICTVDVIKIVYCILTHNAIESTGIYIYKTKRGLKELEIKFSQTGFVRKCVKLSPFS